MNKYLLFASACLFSGFTAFGQIQQQPIKSYDLRIGTRPFAMSANYPNGLEANREIFEQQFFKIVQFHEHPSPEMRAQMQQAGATLIEYLPHYAWLVSFKASFDVRADLSAYGVRAVIEIPLAYKLSQNLQREEYPNHALEGKNIKLVATFFNTLPIQKIREALAQRNIQILGHTEHGFTHQIAVPIADIQQIARLPFVQYLEIAPPPPSFDGGLVEDRSIERGNYLASDLAGGLHFDGSGVKIAVKEGGTIDPLVHPDFKGRLDFSTETGAVSTHKTPVSQRMAGYGNIDPLLTGMAFGADVYATDGNFNSVIGSGAIAVNNSYGFGCSIGNYDASANSHDALIRNNPTFMIAYSAGNEGGTDCNYGAGAGWGTTTGTGKQAKNTLAVGAVDFNDVLTGFSSRGPAPDGRIKPDICAVGPGGTSFACPNAVGAFAQLYHAYRSIYGVTPNSNLIKAILQNTADDLGNPGPDFKHGYGRINLRRAYETIAANTFLTSTINNGGNNPHVLNVPAGTKQVRVMLYWMDFPGTAGAAIALVNNLNLTMTDPNGVSYNPWVLDHTINPVNLDLPAVRGVDALNNMEQITLDNPVAGAYTLNVNGFSVPQAAQSYYIVYEFLEDELKLTYPIGGESMVGGEVQQIIWDSYGNTASTFGLEYSINNGVSWATITTNLPSNTRLYRWTVPNVVTGQARIRVTRGGISDQSTAGFSIVGIPQNLGVVWSCADSLRLSWNGVAGASGYEVFRLGAKYMTSIGTTTNLDFVVNGVSTTTDEYFAVRALSANGAKGRRSLAFKKSPGDVNCVPVEVKANAILSHTAGYIPTCYTPFNNPVKLEILNLGQNPITTISVSYQINSGIVQTETFNGNLPNNARGVHTFAPNLSILTPGTYVLKAWISPSDADLSNDTVTNTIIVYTAATVAYPYTQTFDAFANCSTSSNCNGTVCNLTQSWFNVPYNPSTTIGDAADWRTYSGKTPTGGGYPTGPNGDHTTGTGRYLYAETSSGAGCNNEALHAHSPCVDMSAASNPQLSFWYNGYGSNTGEMHVDALVDGNWVQNVTSPVVGEQGSAWMEVSTTLGSAYAGKKVLFRFRGITGNGFQGDMAFDDVRLFEGAPIVPQLPIELVNFSPRCEQQAVICEWTTASESNNDYFTIEKSSDASQWQAVGTVKAAGNSTNYKSYTFVDKNPANGSDGVGYYRLKQTDYDGRATYSGIQSVGCELSAEVLTFPNPVDKTLTVQGLQPNTALSIVNLQGVILNRIIANNPTQILDFSEYPSGVYLLWLETKDAFSVKKVIKK